MAENKVLVSDRAVSWSQVVRNRAGEVLKERVVPAQGDLYRVVEAFGEFCVEAGGDRLTSVTKALDELRDQSNLLLNEVDEAKIEVDVKRYGKQLSTVVDLYKSLEEYYLYNFADKLRMAGD